MRAMGERTVWIDCDVIRADGGTRTASVTGAMVALGLAIQKLQSQRALKTNPLKDYLAGISVGIVGQDLLLDLSYAEDSCAEVDMNIIMTGAGNLVETQATAEGRAFSSDELNQLIDLARPGIDRMVAVQRSILNFTLPR
jgi:ribonuclease PH